MDALTRLEQLVRVWDEGGDRRALFARTYAGMTLAMSTGLSGGEFLDQVWVSRLLNTFAGYYFTAVDAAEEHRPLVWTEAFTACRDEQVSALQLVLLGVNAHVNRDLPMALADVLDDWRLLDATAHERRRLDHDRVNTVIARLTDDLQGQIVNPTMPALDLLDRLMGSLDERLFAAGVTLWRRRSWQDAQRLVLAADPDERASICREIEDRALGWAQLIRAL